MLTPNKHEMPDKSFQTAVIVQLFGLLLSSLILDGGFLLRKMAISSIIFWCLFVSVQALHAFLKWHNISISQFPVLIKYLSRYGLLIILVFYSIHSTNAVFRDFIFLPILVFGVVW